MGNEDFHANESIIKIKRKTRNKKLQKKSYWRRRLILSLMRQKSRDKSYRKKNKKKMNFSIKERLEFMRYELIYYYLEYPTKSVLVK